MKIRIVPAHSLAPELAAPWSALQAADASLASPFLCPQFARIAGEARKDAAVAVLEQDGVTAGFFPFQRDKFSLGRPIGGWLNDLQAMVATPELDWDCVELLRACGLVEWEFGRLLTSQKPFAPHHRRRHATAFMDLSHGYDGYVAQRRKAGTRIFPKVEALERKLEREVGAVRFEAQSPDTEALRTLMKWKLDRYASRGYEDIFAVGWARELVERVHATREDHFGGMLSLLYAGDELAAALMGMRSRTLWHGWLPAYNPRFARFSPGLILLLRMARHAPRVGLERIELGGPEDYAYKQRLMSGSIALAEGTVDRMGWMRAARELRRSGEKWVRESPALEPVAKGVVRALRKVRQKLS